jgi:hypothetical protein
MAQATEFVFCSERPAFDQQAVQGTERWPLAGTALFVLGSSALLWSLIIAGVHWMIG